MTVSITELPAIQTKKDNQAKVGIEQAIKRYYIHDAYSRVTHIMEARCEALDGETCSCVQYSYVGITDTVLQEREDVTTWSSTWDLTAIDPTNIYPTGIFGGDCYVNDNSASQIGLATSVANAVAATLIDISATGSRLNTLTPQVFAAKTFTDVEVLIASEEITIAGHGYITGLKVFATTAGTFPAPLAALTPYYVIRVDVNTIQLAASEADAFAGTEIDLTTVGAGTITLTPEIFTVKTFTQNNVNITTDLIGITSHGYFSGLKVNLS